MTIGSLRLELFLPESHSLKDKRRVIKSLAERLRRRFNVSVAEVDFQDTWQRAGLAVAAAGSSDRIVRETLEKIVGILRDSGGGGHGGPAILSDHEIELF